MSVFDLGWSWLSFLSFGLSVVAAVLAIDMYKLSRTGQFGASWRVLITASVIYALLQAAHLAEGADINIAKLSRVIELVFVLSLVYAFYLQRQIFLDSSKIRRKDDRPYQGPERRRNRATDYDGTERRADRRAQNKDADEMTAAPRKENEELHNSEIEWRAPLTSHQ